MSEMFGLSGKNAIVWGGGQGMGERSAMRLAGAGCNIAIVDKVGERATKIATAVRALGKRAIALTADATIQEQVERAVVAAESELGALDAMVTVIGAATFKPLLELTNADWDLDAGMNLKSFFMTAQAVARSMLHGGRSGTIIAIASVNGLSSAPMHAAYGAAKAGLVNLVRSMATEWAPAIRVNAIAPGIIETPRIVATPERLESVRRLIPMARMGSTDEIGKAALFLASDLASYVTGQTLAVDGGWMSANLMGAKS